jgi:hypothetical protein
MSLWHFLQCNSLKLLRQARFEDLKGLLVDPAESSAEKFRRVFEALQIEAEYGNTIDMPRT